jgi:hypothetical protein
MRWLSGIGAALAVTTTLTGYGIAHRMGWL